MAAARLAVSAAVLASIAGAVFAQGLSRLSSCPALEAYFRSEALKRVGPYGLPTTPRGIFFDSIAASQPVALADAAPSSPIAPPPAGEDFSETNVQVQGVDEPDVIKTDGERVFILRAHNFSVLHVTDGGASAVLAGSLKLPGYASEMLVRGDDVLVIANDQGGLEPGPGRPIPLAGRFLALPMESITTIYKISVAKKKPKLHSELRMEGRYISAREVNGIARIITSTDPSSRIHFVFPGRLTSNETEEENKERVRRTTFEAWLPRFYLKQASGEPSSGLLSPCSSVFRSTHSFAGFNLLTVTTVPISGSSMKPKSSVSITSEGDDVYGTASSLYVATTQYRYDFDSNEDFLVPGISFLTSVHKFSLSQNGAAYEASGEVTGSVLNQFSMHEYNGVFFIATTMGAPWWSGRDLSVSKLTSFEHNQQKGTLEKLSEVGELGVGERIYAVRYLADAAYVVTFREVDPLYIIDISKPKQLTVTGELKIPGFSTYLHPIAPGRILGVGQEATLQGRTTGAKVTLFDVSNMKNPRELATWSLEGGFSDAEWDHRAFLFWEPQSAAVLPVAVYQGNTGFVGSVVLNISADDIEERGRVSHPECCGPFLEKPRIQRNLVIGKTHLWSLSSNQIQINDIESLSVEDVISLFGK